MFTYNIYILAYITYKKTLDFTYKLSYTINILFLGLNL